MFHGKTISVYCLTVVALVMVAPATFAQAAAVAAADSGDAVPPPGVIAFGRWDDALDDFAVFTMASDGTDEQPLFDGAHEILAGHPTERPSR